MYTICIIIQGFLCITILIIPWVESDDRDEADADHTTVDGNQAFQFHAEVTLYQLFLVTHLICLHSKYTIGPSFSSIRHLLNPVDPNVYL